MVQNEPLRSDFHNINMLTLSPEIDDLFTPSMSELSVNNGVNDISQCDASINSCPRSNLNPCDVPFTSNNQSCLDEDGDNCYSIL